MSSASRPPTHGSSCYQAVSRASLAELVCFGSDHYSPLDCTMSRGAHSTTCLRPYVDISGIPYSAINSLNPVTSSSTMRCKSSA